MNINKNNYEAYFLDYHEGNLSPQEVADLFLFLEEHPELKKELEDFENVVLDDFSAPVFENKDVLKKNITPDNREDYFIRAVEGILDANELILLQTFLTAYPQYLKEFKFFEKTKLQADPSVVFENKTELKQLTEKDVLLISSVEGLLDRKEQNQLRKELASYPELKKELLLYQHTKSTPDHSVVFNDKSILKRKEKKVIPLFYYVSSVAAAIAIIIGLFFMFRPTDVIDKQVVQQDNTTHSPTATTMPMQAEQPTIASTTTIGKDKKNNNRKGLKKEIKLQGQEKSVPVKNDHLPVLTPDASTDLTNSTSPTQAIIDDSVFSETKKNTMPLIVQTDKQPGQIKKNEFPTISDLVSNKLKEKLIGKSDTTDHIANEPAKINGWDIAGIFAKGLTNLTGKKFSVKPKYNTAGEVTAYALSAGKIEFSRVK